MLESVFFGDFMCYFSQKRVYDRGYIIRLFIVLILWSMKIVNFDSHCRKEFQNDHFDHIKVTISGNPRVLLCIRKGQIGLNVYDRCINHTFWFCWFLLSTGENGVENRVIWIRTWVVLPPKHFLALNKQSTESGTQINKLQFPCIGGTKTKWIDRLYNADHTQKNPHHFSII